MVVLFVGRVHELKGLEPLLRAFAQARQRVPDARLVIVGRDDGYLGRMLGLAQELAIADRFYFVGPLYRAEALPAYIDCNLFCITPTHYEETSLAALTACACGRPVLINDRCDIPWLEDDQGGRCVPHSVANLAHAMINMLADPDGLEKQGRNARRMIEERFVWPRVLDQVEDMYRGVATREA